MKIIRCLALFLILSVPSYIFAQNPELVIPVGHKEVTGIYDIAVSPDQTMVVTAANKVVKIWDYHSGLLLKTFLYNGYDFSRSRFTYDNKSVLLTCRDAQYKEHILILNSQTYNITNDIEVNVGSWGLVFSADGQTVYSGGFDKAIVLKIDLNTGLVTKFYELKDGTSVKSLSMSPDGKKLLAMFSKGKYSAEPFVSVVLPTNGGIEKILPENIQYQRFTPTGNLFSLASKYNYDTYQMTYKLTWSDANSLKELATKEITVKDFSSGNTAQYRIRNYDFFEKSDKILFTAEETVWTASPTQSPESFSFVDTRKNGKAVEPKSKITQLVGVNEFIVGTDDNFIYRFDLKSRTLFTEYGIGVLAPDKIRASETGKSFVVTGRTNKPYLVSWQGGRTHIVQFTDAKNKIYAVRETAANVSPDGTLAAYCTDDKLNVVDSRNGNKILNSYNYSKGHHLVISQDNNCIVVSGDDNTISVINRKSGDIREIGVGDFTEGTISADNRYFYGLKTNNQNETITSYFDLTAGKKIWEKKDDIHFLGKQPFIFSNSEVGFMNFEFERIVFQKTSDGSISRKENYSGFHFTNKPILEKKLKYEVTIQQNSTNRFTESRIVQDGAFYIQSVDDNTLKVYRSSNGEKVAEIILAAEAGDWAIVAPDGRFDASESMRKSLYYVKGKQIIPLEALSEKFYTPNLLAQIFSGEVAPIPNNDDIKKLKAAPSVKIGVPVGQRNLIVEDENSNVRHYNMTFEKISLTVDASCPEDGVSEIRLYHNGKLVGSSMRNLVVEDENKTEKSKSGKFDLQLVEGENVFKAIALNTQRTESQADNIIVNYKVQHSDNVENKTNDITLHLLVIGINKYKNPKYNLNYAFADAAGFKEAIEKGGSIFSKTNAVFISDEQATKEGITIELNKIKENAKANDVFIFYYAGHGVLSEKKEFFLVPYDVTQLYGQDESLAQKGLSTSELQQFSKNILAQKQLFILDACQSAGAFENLLAVRGAAEEKAIAQLARSTGTHWLTASGSEQFASEFSELGHGTFTYALLAALSGKADRGGDKKITVKELDAYLQEVVPEITSRYKGTPQYPASYGFGNDFPIGVVKE